MRHRLRDFEDVLTPFVLEIISTAERKLEPILDLLREGTARFLRSTFDVVPNLIAQADGERSARSLAVAGEFGGPPAASLALLSHCRRSPCLQVSDAIPRQVP